MDLRTNALAPECIGVWETHRIERRLEHSLRTVYGTSDADHLWSLYLRARHKVVEEVLPHIVGVEPSLTEHGPAHIRDVFEKTCRLLEIGRDSLDMQLDAAELYSLCTMILFHDVGNVFGREEHEKQIGQVWSWVRTGESGVPAQEQFIVTRGAGAHAGKTESGSRDTLHELPIETDLNGDRVRLQELAAILRLADELAEGPQRTSRFMQEVGGYDQSSMIFHNYASISNVRVDRGNRRVALTYNIRLTGGGQHSERIAEFRRLLEFTYKRIVKLDEERQYARFYSSLLEPFRITSVRFNFWLNDALQALDLLPLELSDKRIPGVSGEPLESRFSTYHPDRVCDLLAALLRER